MLQKWHDWRSHWAPSTEVVRWFAVSAGIAAFMILGVVIISTWLIGSPSNGAHSGLLGKYGETVSSSTFDNWLFIFKRNILVLLLHFFCCLIGAIISRPHKPLPDKWQHYSFMHMELPKWMVDFSLIYALTVTLASVTLQTTGLGFVLSDISAYTGLSSWQLGLYLLPHAPLELTAIFLPLGLFLIQAWRKQLRPLGVWAWQSLIIALPLVALAAWIEVSISPTLLEHAISANGGLPSYDYAPHHLLQILGN